MDAIAFAVATRHYCAVAVLSVLLAFKLWWLAVPTLLLLLLLLERRVSAGSRASQCTASPSGERHTHQLHRAGGRVYQMGGPPGC